MFSKLQFYDMMRILSVSYDEHLLQTRTLLLLKAGYEVTGALGFTESLKRCKEGGFDFFILGHSIPQPDKQKLIAAFRKSCPAPIICLVRNQGDEWSVDGADYQLEADPEALLTLLKKISSKL